MTKIFLVTHFEPITIGHGGNHRSYQMLYELEGLVGSKNVFKIVTPLYSDQLSRPGKRLFWKIINLSIRIFQRIAGTLWYLFFLGNPYNALTKIRPLEKLGNFIKLSSELSFYEKSIKGEKEPVICIIDHPSFECFIDINEKYNIPTIMCGHNIEAFDGYIYDRWSYKNGIYASVLFADEYKCLSRCTRRLMISVIEKNILNGLGLQTDYYPYLPVGEIHDRLRMTRFQRQARSQESGLVLLLGSYLHATTAEGMTWLINGLSKMENPDFPLRLVIIGKGTKNLGGKNNLPLWMEIKEWVEQEELDHLLVLAQGVLIPQRLGFGVVTRMSELACAGIPVIISEHPTNALDIPPGLFIAGNTIEDWITAIKDLAIGNLSGAALSDYIEWEANQKNRLASILNKIAE